MVGAKRRKELGADLRAIFAATSREQALGIASEVAEKWRSEKGNAKVADHLEEYVEECLACLSFPEAHRRRIRTTNGQERLNQVTVPQAVGEFEKFVLAGSAEGLTLP